jgi:hypothetical protein
VAMHPLTFGIATLTIAHRRGSQAACGEER